MAPYTRSEIVSGLFVIVAAVIFTLFSFKVLEVSPAKWLAPRPIVCEAELAAARGLSPGARVSVAGIKVGAVRSMRIEAKPLTEAQAAQLRSLMAATRPSGPEESAAPTPAEGMTRQVVIVEFTIEDGSLRLDPETARVRMAADGLFGEPYLALDPGFWSGDREPLLASRPQGPLAVRGESGASLDELIARLAPAATELQRMLTRVNDRVLNDDNLDDLSSAIQNLDGALAEIRRNFDRADPEGVHALVLKPISDFVANADSSLTQLRERLMNETLTKLESLLDDGARMVDAATKAIENADGAITDARPAAQQALESLASAAEELEASMKTLRADAGEALGAARDILVENRPEVAETMRRLRRTMWEAEMAMRKIRANPAFLLFGDDEQLLDSNPYDDSELRGSGRARPYNQRDESNDGR